MIIQIMLAFSCSLMQLNAITPPSNTMIQKKFDAVIFDMDGTILDTEVLWEQGNRHILATYAPHVTPDEVHAIIHDRKGIRTPDELAKKLLKHCTPDMTLAEIRDIKTAYVFNLYETIGVEFIPHFQEFHGKLVNLGLRHAVATNATKEAVEKITIKTPLRAYFNEHIYTIDTVNSQFKPNPDIYLHAARQLGVQPERCIAIEDTAGGIKAAKAAGMYCIGINTGNNRDLLAQADEIVECFSEINLEKLLSLEI